MYIIGNHDMHLEFLEKLGIKDSNIEFKERHVYNSHSYNRILIMHGHQWDGFILRHPWLYWIGDKFYGISVWLNKWNNWIRFFMGLKQWSLSLWLKQHVKSSLAFINHVDKHILIEARKNHSQIIVYGHTHCLKDEKLEGIRVINCGCFTEYSSAVIERFDGTLELIKIEKDDVKNPQ